MTLNSRLETVVSLMSASRIDGLMLLRHVKMMRSSLTLRAHTDNISLPAHNDNISCSVQFTIDCSLLFTLDCSALFVPHPRLEGLQPAWQAQPLSPVKRGYIEPQQRHDLGLLKDPAHQPPRKGVAPNALGPPVEPLEN